MTQFHEGQDVEVICAGKDPYLSYWRKAKIVRKPNNWDCTMYQVQFPDGPCDVFDQEYIRVDNSAYLAKIGAEMKARDAKPLGERYRDERDLK